MKQLLMLLTFVTLLSSCSTYTFYKNRERSATPNLKTSKYGYEFEVKFNQSMKTENCLDSSIMWHAMSGVKTNFWNLKEESCLLKWAWIKDVNLFIVTAMTFGERGDFYEFDDEWAYAYACNDTMRYTIDYDNEFWYITIEGVEHKILRTFHPDLREDHQHKRTWAVGPKLNKYCNNKKKVKIRLKTRT